MTKSKKRGRLLHGHLSGGPKMNERVFAWVRKIPKGKVMTYGQISVLLNNRVSAQFVGWMMHRSPKGVPWHRVVNASGGCSTERLPSFPLGMQRHLLEKEKIRFSKDGTLDLKKYRWLPQV